MKNPKRVAAGKKSRSKGSNNERAVAKEFEAWWQHGQWARTPLSGGWASKDAREGFRTCGDIITTAADFPFCIELKKQEGWFLDQLIHNDKCVVLEWWKQAVDESPKGLIPLLVMARNHVPQAVVFQLEMLEALCVKVKWSGSDGWLWSNHPLLVLEFPRDRHGMLVVMSLENFFKISPEAFGRRLPDVKPTGQAEAIG